MRSSSCASGQKRNFLTTLLLSAGVPLLLAGDERGRTQLGNNNPYCQDNQTSWVDWGLDEPRTALLEFTKHLIALRAAHPVLRRPKFYQGHEIRGSGVKDITWFTPDGAQMDDTKMWEPDIHTLGMFLNGEAIFAVDCGNGLSTTASCSSYTPAADRRHSSYPESPRSTS